MGRITTAKIRKIGNSRGILFPKEVLEKSGIKETVKIYFNEKEIQITSADKEKKKKWSDFKKVRTRKVKADFVVNTFDEKDWTW